MSTTVIDGNHSHNRVRSNLGFREAKWIEQSSWQTRKTNPDPGRGQNPAWITSDHRRRSGLSMARCAAYWWSVINRLGPIPNVCLVLNWRATA